VNAIDVAWPTSRLGEALIELAREAGLRPNGASLAPPPEGILATEGARLARWVEQAASYLGVEAEAVEPTHSDIERWVHAAPILLPIVVEGGSGWLALVQAGTRCRVLGADGAIHRFSKLALLHGLRAPLETPLRGELDALLGPLGLRASRHERARRALSAERLHGAPLPVAFLLAPRRTRSYGEELRRQGAMRSAALLFALHGTQFVFGLASFALFGRMALMGRLDTSWIAAWAVLVLTQIALSMVEGTVQGKLALTAGLVLRDRLLFGILKLGPEEVRGEGVGALLGRVLESQITESQALGAVLGGVAGTLELVVCLALLLGAATSGHLLAGALVVWLAFTLFLARRMLRERRRHAAARLRVTHELVEGTAGYRTRLVHETSGTWHQREDQLLAGYAEASRRADRYSAWLSGLIPRGWFIVGFVCLAPTLVQEQIASDDLAIAFGLLLLSYRSFRRLVAGLDGAVECSIAWEQLAPVLAAAARDERPGAPLSAALLAGPARTTAALVEAHDVTFRHRPDREPVLSGLNLRIASGDRFLLLGDSGGGKSTLSSILAGLREPQSGVLLHRGLDRATLGEHEWRRRIALAPQFHENHVFANTLGFNLLMARRWPPTPEDIAEAEKICAELGLDAVIARMPGGLSQLVGETGWQLSHGERSRVFIARALLQDPDLLILDESFAALDPDTFRKCLAAVVARARALVIVAHP
jgi:ATP-binding cassette subfamily B protein